MTIRLGFLLPNLECGGAEKVTVELIRTLAGMSYEIDLLLLSKSGPLLTDLPNSINIIELKTFFFPFIFLKLLVYFASRRCHGFISAMWPLTSLTSFACALSCSQSRVLTVEHTALSFQYDSKHPIFKYFLRSSLWLSHRLSHTSACVSHGVIADLAELSFTPISHFVCLYNPVTSPVHPRSSQHYIETSSFCFGKPGYRILYVGQLKEPKNIPLLLEAFSLLSTSYSLTLVGEGRLKSSLIALCRQLKIKDRVAFAGYHKDVSPFYLSADVLALSSDREGLPTVLIEALGYGLSVVSTDCPYGPSEILDNGKYGCLVPCNNPDLLSAAISHVSKSPFNPVSQQARAAEFSPARCTKLYLSCLDL